MSYTLRPSRQEFEKVRNRIDEAFNIYSHGLELEKPEIFLSWRDLESGFQTSHVEKGKIYFTASPESEKEDMQEKVLRGLLEAEFLEKAPYEVQLGWQEAAKFAYVAKRLEELAGQDIVVRSEIAENWEELEDSLTRPVDECGDFFYLNTGLIGEALAGQLESHSSDEIPKMSKSDIERLGKRL